MLGEGERCDGGDDDAENNGIAIMINEQSVL